MSVFETNNYYKVTAVSHIEDSTESNRSKKKKITERLKAISDDFKNALMDLASWADSYALVEATKGENLGLSKSRLIGISKLMNHAYCDLIGYIETLPKPNDLQIAEEMMDLVKTQFLTRIGYLTFSQQPGCPEFSLGLILFSLDRKKREELGVIIEHLYEEIPDQNWKEVIDILNQLVIDLP